MSCSVKISYMQTARKMKEEQPVTSAATVAELLQLLEEKDQALEQKEHIIEAHNRLITEQQKLLKLLEEQLRLAKLQRFGSSSEKLPFQWDFFDEAELEVALRDIEEQLPDDASGKPSRKKREGFSDKLPRVRIDISLSDEEKAGASKTFFTKVKEELDIIPAQARIIEYWQEKAVFDKEGEQCIKVAARSAHPLGKCIASVQLLAYILVAKYADALPLYRLEQILKRYGGNISRTTMANWVIRLDDVFKPLINLLRERQLEELPAG